MLERIWSPWRAQYIREGLRAGSRSGGSRVFFLPGAGWQPDDRANLLVWRVTHSVVVLEPIPL